MKIQWRHKKPEVIIVIPDGLNSEYRQQYHTDLLRRQFDRELMLVSLCTGVGCTNIGFLSLDCYRPDDRLF